MSNAPLVTVLMSVYNGERYLHEAVQSILNQTFTAFEFLIINDGSTDGSRNILGGYADPRIRLIDNPSNLGLTRSLNHGLRMARGTYVARQDADDISEPRRLAQQVRFMDANPDLALLGTWYREMDAAGKVGNKVRLPTDQVDLEWALLFHCPFVHSSVMLRRETFLREVGLYDESYLYAQDHELWLRTSRQRRVTNLPACLVRYRLHPLSMTENRRDLTGEGVWIATQAVGSLLGWHEQEKIANRARFEKMLSLMFGDDRGLGPAEVNGVTDMLYELQHAFAVACQLDQRQVERHRAGLRERLGKSHVRLALGYAARGLQGDAWSMYRRGLRLHPPALFTTKSARLLCNLLAIQPLRTLWSYVRSR